MTNPLPDDISLFFKWLQQIEDALDVISTYDRMVEAGRAPSKEMQDAYKAAKKGLAQARNLMAGLLGSDDGLKVANRLTEAQKKRVMTTLAKLGLSGMGKAFGATASKAGSVLGKGLGGAIKGLGKVVGRIAGPVLDILLNPTPTGGGWEEKEIDRITVKIDGVCYDIVYYIGRNRDELMWSNVYSRTSKPRPCPESTEVQSQLQHSLAEQEMRAFASLAPMIEDVLGQVERLQPSYQSDEARPDAETISVLHDLAGELCLTLQDWKHAAGYRTSGGFSLESYRP